jgi:hypothetical protein
LLFRHLINNDNFAFIKDKITLEFTKEPIDEKSDVENF